MLLETLGRWPKQGLAWIGISLRARERKEVLFARAASFPVPADVPAASFPEPVASFLECAVAPRLLLPKLMHRLLL